MKIDNKIINNKLFRSIVLIFLCMAGLSANPFLTLLSILVLILILYLFWKPGLPAILLFIFTWQWIQITIKTFYANILGLNVSIISDTGSSHEVIMLSLIGIIIMVIGASIATRNLPNIQIDTLKAEAKIISTSKLFKLYLLTAIISIVIREVLFIYPGLTQLIVGLLNIKVLIIILIIFTSLLSTETKKYLIAVIILEVILGFGGFFSGFKTIFFYLFIVSLTIYDKIKFRTAMRFALVSVVVLILGLFWSVIREDYRVILNKGSGMQEVLISPEERAAALYDLFGSINSYVFYEAIEFTIFRISYTDIFGQVVDRVPAYTTYENGFILMNSMRHIIMPRILFPHKNTLDDSELTNYYTGKNYPGMFKGTSVGLGYMTEFYIDFGPYVMFIPLFFLGYCYGLIFRYFIKKSNPKLLNYSMLISVLFTVYLFETTQAKVIGGVLSSFLIMVLINRFLSPFILKYIQKP